MRKYSYYKDFAESVNMLTSYDKNIKTKSLRPKLVRNDTY